MSENPSSSRVLRVSWGRILSYSLSAQMHCQSFYARHGDLSVKRKLSFEFGFCFHLFRQSKLRDVLHSSRRHSVYVVNDIRQTYVHQGMYSRKYISYKYIHIYIYLYVQRMGQTRV